MEVITMKVLINDLVYTPPIPTMEVKCRYCSASLEITPQDIEIDLKHAQVNPNSLVVKCPRCTLFTIVGDTSESTPFNEMVYVRQRQKNWK